MQIHILRSLTVHVRGDSESDVIVVVSETRISASGVGLLLSAWLMRICKWEKEIDAGIDWLFPFHLGNYGKICEFNMHTSTQAKRDGEFIT